MDMSIFEFDQQLYLEVRCQDAMENGIQQGLTKGREEGREEGRQEGRAYMILDLLNELGSVSENMKQQILGERDVDRLRQWGKLAAAAESVHEFEMAM